MASSTRPGTCTVLALAVVLAIASAALGSRAASAQAWKPFTQVNDVCPKCSGGPAFDQIALTAGSTLRARVLGENEAFYLVERFGELRALARDQVSHITRTPAADRPPGWGDQILLADGIVLAGTMDATPAPDADHFEIKVPGTAIPLHTAARATVAAVFRGGKRVWTAGK